jgi:hypothetical protein
MLSIDFLQAGIDADEGVSVAIKGGRPDKNAVNLDDVGLSHRRLLEKSKRLGLDLMVSSGLPRL